LADTVTLAFRQWRLERRMFWRNPSAAFFSFAFPLIFLFLFGSIFSGSRKDLDVIIPGIAGMSIMATTFTALAINMTFLREEGVLKRIRGTPQPGGAYLAGLAANAVTNAAIQIVIVTFAGRLVFGIGWPRNLLELIVFAVAGVACLAALGVAFSHVIPNFDAAPAYTNIVFLPAIFISGVFFDTTTAPQFLTDIAKVLPLTHIIQGLRAGFVTGAPLSDHLGDLAVIAVWAVAGIALAVRGFSWDQTRD
jgi:ABC-2 type transport system permease protein